MTRQTKDKIIRKNRTDRPCAWRLHGAKCLRVLACSLAVLGSYIATNAAIAEEQNIEERLTKLGLPSITSLTIHSDYTVFMRPGIPDDIRVIALRKLWSHPRFNALDQLDAYAADFRGGRTVVGLTDITTAVQLEPPTAQ